VIIALSISVISTIIPYLSTQKQWRIIFQKDENPYTNIELESARHLHQQNLHLLISLNKIQLTIITVLIAASAAIFGWGLSMEDPCKFPSMLDVTNLDIRGVISAAAAIPLGVAIAAIIVYRQRAKIIWRRIGQLEDKIGYYDGVPKVISGDNKFITIGAIVVLGFFIAITALTSLTFLYHPIC